MTAFVLVSGPFTGGWLWEETVAPLRAAGSEAYPVTLTGMGAGTPTVTGDPTPARTGDPTEESRAAVRRAMRAVLGRLRS
ncbi:hypothetical protein [Streptomyces zaomyceticus]|uniref:hypothetical protein n=1 Tax=Streptomyces zaomyceticus TaxID=68286 RepID=UPI0033B2089D